MLNNNNIPNLVNGVSQQAEALRFPSQVTEQLNGRSSPVAGMQKRAPTEHIAKIYNTGTSLSQSYFYTIDRDEAERYVMVVGQSTSGGSPIATLDVFNLDTGVKATILDSGGSPVDSTDLAYLVATNGAESIKVTTIGDNTIIANAETATAMESTLSPGDQKEALIFVKSIRETSVVGIDLYNTPGGGSADYSVTYTPTATDDQTDVAAGLVSALNTASANAVYTYSQQNHLIYLRKTDNSDFRIEATSDLPDGTTAIKDRAQSITDLPNYGYVGFTVEVQGSVEGSNDVPYYVTYVANEDAVTSGFAEGFWEETVKTGIAYKLDATTCPHTLVNTGVNAFTFKPITWSDRTVGTTTTNPDPTFVGNKINNVFYFQNRLGMLSGENVILSEIGEFFNFFRTTTLSVLDSDVIDLAAATPGVLVLRSAVQVDDRMIVFADEAQFVLSSTGALSPSTATMTLLTRYSSDVKVDPVTIGPDVVFAFQRGEFSGLQQYTKINEFDRLAAIDLSDHVPQYISGRVETVATLSSERSLCVVSSGFANGFYVYNFLDQADDRVQSAWSKYQFNTGDTVHYLTFIDDYLHVVVEHFDGIFLERMNFAENARDANSTFMVSMDRRIDETQLTTISYSSSTNLTTLTLPYTPEAGLEMDVVTRNTSSFTGGAVLDVNSRLTNQLTLIGDWSTTPLWIGMRYTLSQTLTRPIPRQQSGSRSVAINRGSYRIRYAKIHFNDTALFQVSVTNRSKTTYNYAYSGRNLGTDDSGVGNVVEIRDGTFKVPVYNNASDIELTLENSSPLPCNLLNLDWEGYFVTRS